MMDAVPGVTIAGLTGRRRVPADRDVFRSRDFIAGPLAGYTEVRRQGCGKM